jgi:hypothetical protein
MANGTVISVPIGTDFPFQVTLLDTAGDPVTTYTSGDTPFSEVWAGQDQPVLLTPTCTWISAPEGTFQAVISGDTTTSISPGKYRLRNGVNTASGLTVVIPDTFIEFTFSPGSGTTLTTYCQFTDLLKWAPWISDLQSDTDESGFIIERNTARKWLERIIQRHNFGTYWNDFATPLFGFQLGGDDSIRNWGQTDPVLQGWLDDDYLLVNEQVIEITAKYAIYMVCQSQVGPNNESTAWQQRANDFYADAQRLVTSYSAELYQPGNQIAPLKVIPCGRATLR